MKKNKVLFLLLIVLVILNVCILTVLVYKAINKRDVEQLSPTSEEYTETKSLKIENPSDLLNMDIGDIPSSTIINYSRKYIEEFLPFVYGDMKNNIEINNTYYEKNKAKIYNYSNINNYDDFKKLSSGMKNTEINFKKYQSIKFLKSEINGKNVIIDCEIKYEGNYSIKLKINFLNKVIQKTSVEF